jgi:hypothetical protein
MSDHAPILPDDERPAWERIAELSERLPDEVVDLMPTDAASQLDHYLYGATKTEPEHRDDGATA